MRPVTEALQLLVIEDNAGDYLLISEYLEDYFKNSTLFQAKTYREAKALLQNKVQNFDAILLDLSLPDSHGENLITDIQQIAPDIPVIILTGNSDLSFSIKSLSLGVSDYLVKDDLSPVALFKSIAYSMERKEIQLKLQKTQKQYQDLFDLSPLPIFIYDIDSLRFLDVNDAALLYYGYTKEEFKNLTLQDIRPKEGLPKLMDSIERLKLEKKQFTINNTKHQKKNGETMFVEIHGFLIKYDGRLAETIVVHDVTRQKMYENDILEMNKKLRNLSAHLHTVREEERSYIAREIHDELGQQLTGIKLDVSWLKNYVERQLPEASERTKRLIESVNKTINDVRKIATNLRPGVLDDLGLEAAIEWQTSQFEEQTGLQCELQFHNVSDSYSKEINTNLYRIFQEALTNIIRHAKATKVTVHFYKKNNTLVLEVVDDGKGIHEKAKDNNKSLGITGMRERALMINGTFSINKNKEKGTTVRVEVPV